MTVDPGRAARVRRHLEVLCAVIPDRRPGSDGNTRATDYVRAAFVRSDWSVTRQEFACLDWSSQGGRLTSGSVTVELTPSPYCLGTEAQGPLRVLSTLDDLTRSDLGDAVLLITGELAEEPLTPKGYPFYGSEDHARIVAALESARPAAVVAVTGRYPALCGALDPFPLIEDGDFTVPTANVRKQDAAALFELDGSPVAVDIRAQRRLGRAANVVAQRGPVSPRVTVMAHIDSKPGTPGAVDNAAGVVVLMLLADLLVPERHPELPVGVELLAVNGEDHFAAPGEVAWLDANAGALDDIVLAVNIDGAGYRGGRTAFSTYNVEGAISAHVAAVLSRSPSLVRGPGWYQSDHAIFAMQGRPALAFTTELLEDLLDTLYHAPTDTPDQVDTNLIVELTEAIEELIVTWP